MTKPSSEDPSQSIRRVLLGAGFDRVGFAAVSETPNAAAYREWLKDGHAGSMEYLARTVAKRADPRRVLEGTKSIIVVALHYSPSAGPPQPAPPPSADDTPVGRIAAYARGEDYHRVMEKRLKRICADFRRTHSALFRYYVDTGPVVERAWAQKAGIGWIGKNTCAIDPSSGSYFFLAVILTSLDLPPDAPLLDHCGSCTLCLDACPTDAFPAPYKLDARRCISYLTIEHRDEIPPHLANQFGDWIFGCDVCQEVCPFNRDPASLPADSELSARPENTAPRLVDLVQLDAEQFAERFRRSAVRRARADGLLRNVLIALGNSPPSASQRVLERAAQHPAIGASEMLSVTLRRARERLRGH